MPRSSALDVKSATLPVKPEWVPNVFVNVTLESGKRSVMREAMMKVSPREHILQVTIDPDKPDAMIWFNRGKWVIGDFGIGKGGCLKETALA